MRISSIFSLVITCICSAPLFADVESREVNKSRAKIKEIKEKVIIIKKEIAALDKNKEREVPVDDITDLKNRVAALETRPVTPPSRPNVKDGIGIFFTAEPLFWKVSEEGLEYAITGEYHMLSKGNTFYNLNLEDGKTRHPDFDWNWGCRLGAGYDLSKDGWDITSYWTHFYQKANDHVRYDGDPNASDFIATGGSGNYISPFWVAQLFSVPGLMNQASAHWTAHLNLVDLELGREFFISKFLALRPFIGLRTGWINQKYNLRFLAFNFPTDPSVIERQISVKMQNNFWGLGGRGGLDTQWFLGKGFSIYGNGAVSLLDGHFHVRYKLHDQKLVQTQKQAFAIGPVVVMDIFPPYDDSFENSNDVHTTVAMADIALGLRWERLLSGGRYYLSFWAGYEQNIFFRQNQFMNFKDDFKLIPTISAPNEASGPNFFTNHGNLTARGLTGGVEFGF